MMKHLRSTAWLLPLVLAAGCSDSDPNRKETFPVTGLVLVDGKPAPEVQVVFHDLAGMDTAMPTYSSTFTKEDGRFTLSTYDEGDGVPAGEYAVTFFWGQFNPISMHFGGPDKLRDKYSDPKKTPFKFKVAKGESGDMGTIELTAK
jgi:hypothetical protein